MTEQTNEKQATWTEEFEVEAHKLGETLKSLLQQSNTHRIIVRKQDDTVLLDIPVLAGVAAGGLSLYIAPFLTILAGITAALFRVKLQVIRRVEEPGPSDVSPAETATSEPDVAPATPEVMEA
jgi:hypothetical protein